MPSCPLCATDFPALPADTACKRCVALQVLGADPEHPNYVQTQVNAAVIPFGLGTLILCPLRAGNSVFIAASLLPILAPLRMCPRPFVSARFASHGRLPLLTVSPFHLHVQ